MLTIMKKNPIENYVTVDVEEKKRDLKIIKEFNGEYSANIDLTLMLNVVEYPKDTLYIEEHTERLNEAIKNKLQVECEEVIRLIQEANCDYFGIGKHIMAYHYEDWKQMDWEEKYQQMTINTSVETEIIYHGIVTKVANNLVCHDINYSPHPK
ncbi:Ger(x)C family spore germination C-terminal domain-containing protein [Geomicrobium sp. JCM 19055]|uniref:Ger(x)C family spore germination C-terminal domain-containing protein n=1 Tax=Geomicrobium sp. JCM 19055 TaxID=1460649 RepID=UPI002235A1DF|nr:Ger(x)C family spore germination C-terminal domain-containing protein [Geomicrobium sp. JCM 19055]